MNSRSILALNVKFLRAIQSWTQGELEARAELKPGDIGKLERGELLVRIQMLENLATVLKVPVWELLRPRDHSGR